MSRFPTYIVTAIPTEFRWDAVMVIVIAIILLCLLMKLVSMNKEIRKLNSKISQIQDNRSAEDKEQNVISSPNGKNIILLVEDEIETIDMLDRCLSKEYKIIKVSNGNDALTLAQELNPDIVISDTMIPGLSGDELCRTLKSSVATSHIPVILLAAIAAREAIVHGLEAGASDYILKPCDPEVMKARIKNILRLRNTFRKDIMNADPENSSTDYANLMDKEFLNKVMNIMNEEMQNSELSINDLCRKMGVSRTILYNKLKTLTGQPPNDFIRVVRLNKAKELLESHRYMISEVADMVGFSDPKYFSVCYKKQFGMSPSKV